MRLGRTLTGGMAGGRMSVVVVTVTPGKKTYINGIVMVVEDNWDVDLWADFEEVVYIVAYLDE
jgi:hypothetical protein